MLNVLKYPKEGEACAFSPEGRQLLENTPELSYLTQIVFRLFRQNDDANSCRCEIYFSPGAKYDTNGAAASVSSAIDTSWPSSLSVMLPSSAVGPSTKPKLPFSTASPSTKPKPPSSSELMLPSWTVGPVGEPGEPKPSFSAKLISPSVGPALG